LKCMDSQTASASISTDLIPAVPTSQEISNLSRIEDQAREFVAQSKATNTVNAYRSDWEHFNGWCRSHGLVPLPATPETVGLYVSDFAATFKTSTLIRRTSAISQAHQIAGFETPTKSAKVRLVMAGIRRMNGTAAVAKTPVLVEDLKRMIARLPEGLLGVRDRALLLIGFCGGFRRSELVGLDLDAVAINRDGIVVHLRRSKTDQDGEGRKIGIPYGSNPDTCPVRSLQNWLDASAITEGSLFRPITRHGKMSTQRLSSKAVAAIVKRCAKVIGLDATDFAGHSLRSGLATSAAMAGASERSIINQTCNRSVTMVRRYIRDGSLFRENAAATLGL
jgi:site-specific recombinase XerD